MCYNIHPAWTFPRTRGRLQPVLPEVEWSCSGNLYVISYREARKDDWRSKQQAVKQDLLSQKLAAANAQEQAKMAMFHNMLPSGAKLTIPKRQ